MTEPDLVHVTKTGHCLQAKPRRCVVSAVLRKPLSIKSLYIHVPFCFHKCHYCDFFSIVDSQDRQALFVDRMCAEIDAAAPWMDGPLETIFVGGGTPTLLSTASWARLLDRLTASLVFAEGCEFTIEANPETVAPEIATLLFRRGVNRISIGAQSFEIRHLKTLERWHEPASVGRSVDILRTTGFGAINLDLIFGIPGQTVAEWGTDLEQALTLQPDHLSCYNLTYEANTPMTTRRDRGELEPVENEVESEMYQLAIDRLADAGFEHYEISAWAKPGQQCRHNLAYWRNENWWALGPGAAGHADGVRWKNVPRLTEYLESSGLPPVQDVEQLDDDGRVAEAMIMGLRLREGMPRMWVEALVARGGRGEQRHAAITRNVEIGLLEWRDDFLRLSERGLFLADDVLVDLL